MLDWVMDCFVTQAYAVSYSCLHLGKQNIIQLVFNQHELLFCRSNSFNGAVMQVICGRVHAKIANSTMCNSVAVMQTLMALNRQPQDFGHSLVCIRRRYANTS